MTTLKSSIKLCMFDQYGTVVDMQTGLRDIRYPLPQGQELAGDPNAFVTWWRRTHFENSMIDALLQREQHPTGRSATSRSARSWTAPASPTPTKKSTPSSPAIERLRPFPEVPEALARLHQHYKLAVLSNGDPDMLEAAKPHHGIAFDAIISVAEANAFKPHRATYEIAAAKLNLPLDEILFVANHEFDCVGAKATGMRAAFIDRRKRPFARWPHQPDLIVASMTELADHLT